MSRHPLLTLSFSDVAGIEQAPIADAVLSDVADAVLSELPAIPELYADSVCDVPDHGDLKKPLNHR